MRLLPVLFLICLSADAQVPEDADYVLIPRPMIKQLVEQNIALRLRAMALEDERDVALKDVQICQSVHGS